MVLVPVPSYVSISQQGRLDHGLQDAPVFLCIESVSGPVQSGQRQGVCWAEVPQAIPLCPLGGEPLYHLQSPCRTGGYG